MAFEDDSNNIHTEVAVMKKEVQGLQKVVEKLDVTIDKLSDLTQSLDKMVLMQQSHIDQQSQDDEEIKNKLAVLGERVKRIEQSKWFVMGIAATIGFIFAQMEILKRFFS
jgi:t-SNARE complex subunit (syntaxin)